MGDAPVPPSEPEIRMASAFAFATPAATVPTPAWDTSFTLIRAWRFAFFKVEDQLRKVFDGINIVVRRRRDKPNTRCRVAHASDPFIYFMAGQLTAFARFSTLRHFDLQLIGVGKVVAGYAETSGSYLLDGRPFPVAICFFLVACFVFSTFTAIAFAADAVHGNGQRAVCFVRDGSERHRAGSKTLEDFFHRFLLR